MRLLAPETPRSHVDVAMHAHTHSRSRARALIRAHPTFTQTSVHAHAGPCAHEGSGTNVFTSASVFFKPGSAEMHELACSRAAGRVYSYSFCPWLARPVARQPQGDGSSRRHARGLWKYAITCLSSAVTLDTLRSLASKGAADLTAPRIPPGRVM